MLVEIAWVDGVLSDDEETHLYAKGGEFGFERDYVSRIVEELRPPGVEAPVEQEEPYPTFGKNPLEDRNKIPFKQVPDGSAILGCETAAFKTASQQAISYGLDISSLSEPSRHSETLASFLISETPVTNAQYAEFAKAVSWNVPSNWHGADPAGWYPADLADHPVTNVKFTDAEACATWYGGRLPRNFEWERAARGTDGRAYPWGKSFAQHVCHCRESAASSTAGVYDHPAGASPDGLLDMVGNVNEWTDAGTGQYKAVRGGSYEDMCQINGLTWAVPMQMMEDTETSTVGFRVVRSIDEPETVNIEHVLRTQFQAIKYAEALIGCPPDVLHEIRDKYSLADSLVDKLRRDGFKPMKLKPYWMARFAVTNLQYWQFVHETARTFPSHWLDQPLRWPLERLELPPSESWLRDGAPFLAKYLNHPVVNVSFDDAVAYCKWLSQKIGRSARIPTTNEWQVAARGSDGKIYPWGNEFEASRCNYSGSGLGRTEDVAAIESGDSPTGCRQMVGNVFEWTTDSSGNCRFHGGSYASAAEVYGLAFLAMETSRDYTSEQLGIRVLVEN
jgi:formylglycine-generating enzyme required for sulfatase activity